MKTTRFRYALAALGVVAVTSVAAVGGRRPGHRSADKNIVQTASDAGQFTTLISLAGQGSPEHPALQAHRVRPDGQGLRKGAEGDPSEAAAQPRPAPRSPEQHHVVKGDVKAAQVVKLRQVRTLNGASVRIGVKGTMST